MFMESAQNFWLIKPFLDPDMEKLSSSLAVLAEIFEEVAEISREGYRCFVKILEEYKLECKYSYKMIKILLLLAIIMVLKWVLEVILVLGNIIKHKYVSA